MTKWGEIAANVVAGIVGAGLIGLALGMLVYSSRVIGGG